MKPTLGVRCSGLAAILILSFNALSQTGVRARDLGVPFDGVPGALNAITDVAGVEVGHTTLISGDRVRTGVTAILPRGKKDSIPVFAGYFSQNGNGEMTGTAWVEESGFAESPILITNTHSVGTVRDATIKWLIKQAGPGLKPDFLWSLPIVAETWDGFLNDINGFHVHDSDAFHALDSAHAGALEEGSVGGGTGMVCYGFKGGIGTSSRKVQLSDAPQAHTGGYTVGVLVQCNCGRRALLRIAGVPVGKEITQNAPYAAIGRPAEDLGSIIIIVATDAPLLPHQLKRLARRATMGLARTGSISGNGSGDLFLAFSTANRTTATQGLTTVQTVANDSMDPIFEATVEATEEAIANAMVASPAMKGIDGHEVIGIPHDQLRETLKKYNRLASQ